VQGIARRSRSRAPGERADTLERRGSEGAPRRSIIGEGLERGLQLARVVWVDEQAASLDDLGQGAAARCDAASAAGRRLDGRQAEPFFQGGKEQRECAGIQVAECLVGNEAGEMDALLETVLRDSRLECCHVGVEDIGLMVADQQQVQSRSGGGDCGESIGRFLCGLNPPTNKK